MAGYTNQQNVENYLNRPLNDEEAAFFDLLNEAAADIIDGYCARTFSIDRAEQMTDNTIGDKSNNPFMRFDGGQMEIFFDTPLQTDTSISGVTTPYVGYMDVNTGNWTILDPQYYLFYPLNSKVKTSIFRNLGNFPYGVGAVFVYGTYVDYITPPQGIVTAASIMIADIIDLPDGLSKESIEGYSRDFSQDWNPTIAKVLDVYRRVVL